MKCWQCGYDLHMHNGPKCPECGADKGRIMLRANRIVIFTVAIVAALVLLAYSSLASGTAHGSLLPFGLFFAPVAFFGAIWGFLLGLPLYLAYAGALCQTTSRRSRQNIVRVIIVIHYIAFFAVLCFKPNGLNPSNWEPFTWRIVSDPYLGWVGPTVFALVNIALVTWALRRDRFVSERM